MPLTEHARDITPPIAPRPPQALFHQVETVFKRSQDFRLFVVLEANLLVMGNEPSGNEIVVVCIQSVSPKPFFSGETVDEGFVF